MSVTSEQGIESVVIFFEDCSVGILRGLSPEEMENAFQELLEEWERNKAKTA